MSKSSGTFDGEYAPVASRITLFRERHPTGRIVTDLVSRDGGVVVFRASVYRDRDEREPAATGWASEREGDGEINTVACLENTETSAIGRALANLGFLASTKRPSLEEMRKADRVRARLGLSEGLPADDATPAAAATPARQPAPPQATRRPLWADPLQRRADAVSDVLDLLRTAERRGLRPRRARAMRDHVVATSTPERDVAALARLLRRWIARRADEAVGPVTTPLSYR
jgi:hypothetical protein